jgi:hypothetical protein
MSGSRDGVEPPGGCGPPTLMRRRCTIHLSAHRALLALAIVSASMPARAFEVERSETRYSDRQYQYDLVVTLDAAPERVESVLRDYENYPSLDARILAAHVLERPEADVAILETKLRACFGPFCRTVKRIERVEESPHLLFAVTDPERSDVESGETRTELSGAGEGRTRVIYRIRIIPGFWVPAWGGRRWLLNTLEDATERLFRNVEDKAKAAADAEKESLASGR